MSIKKKPLQSTFKWIAFAILLAISIRILFIGVFKVPTITMAPTLISGDYILSNKLAYGLKWPWMQSGFFVKSPNHGDIVVFKRLDRPQVQFVKRVVGLPGDKVMIKQGELYINSQKCSYTVDESYHSENFQILFEECFGQKRRILKAMSGELKSKDTEETQLKENEVYVLGDNRDTSEDSRDWGPIQLDQVSSKVFSIWLSWSSTQDSIFKEKGFRFSRFLTMIQ